MDNSAEDLRKVEAEIDQEYSSNLLLSRSFGTAAWNLLSFIEDSLLAPYVQGRNEGPHAHAASVDEAVNIAKYPLAWLYHGCTGGERLVQALDPVLYQAARDLLKLARAYHSFTAVFQYWSRGELDLRLEGNVLQSTHTFTESVEYEAYCRLIAYRGDPEQPALFENILSELDAGVRVSGRRTSITVSPRLMKALMNAVEPWLTQRFSLPEKWQLSRYSLEQFRLVYLGAYAIALAQFRARRLQSRMAAPISASRMPSW